MSTKHHPIDSKYRYVLFPLALLYWGILFWRNLFYIIGFFVSKRLPCKVISIGNLTAGGTGKTPAVIALANLLKSKGHGVAVLSRGYGRKTTGTRLVTDGKSSPENWRLVGDEPALMAEALQDIPIAVDENRYRGGTYLMERFNPDFIILDDAFQHRSLMRDLDIVLLNSGDTPSDHKLLPYGILREPWIHLGRADVLFFTKTNLKKPSFFLKRKAQASKIPFYNSIMEPGSEFMGIDGQKRPVSEFTEKSIFAFSGVGDPMGFQRTLEKAGLSVTNIVTFTDHHDYNQGNVRDLQKQFEQSNCEILVTTEKDLIKLKDLDTIGLPIYSLPIEFILDKKGKEFFLKLAGV